MDEFKSNVPGTFVQKISRKTVYLTLLAVVAVATVAGLMLAPTFNGTATVSAQKQRSTVVNAQMMTAAVDMKSAGGFAVYAAKGSSARAVKGETFDGRTDSEAANQARTDLKASMNYIKQLPCTDVQGSDLGGRTFSPGVYCVDSARLAGEMSLSAGGDSAGMFIFKVKGNFTADDNASISLSDGAASGNVYFVADNAARIGTNADIKAHVIANGDVTVGAGTKLSGRAVSATGTVEARDAELSAEAGTLQICKAVIFPDNTAGAEADTFTNRIFTFTVAGITVTVPAGQCAAPITVPSGVQTIQEANTGTFTNMTGSFTGGFILDHVDTITNLSNSSVVGINAPLRQVIVNIGDPGSLLAIRVFNRPAVTGVVELCKLAATTDSGPDPDVAGVFRFTVSGVFAPAASGAPGSSALQVFLAPLGGCSGPITVTAPSPFPFPPNFVAFVSELGPALAAAAGPGAPTGYFLESVTLGAGSAGAVGATQFNARLNANPYGSITAGANVGGGVTPVLVITNSPVGSGDPNDATNETRVNFTDRSLPGIAKVCKIAGPGIPLNTPFLFEVRGTVANADGSLAADQTPRQVTVLAGPAAQGGNCNIVTEANGAATRYRIGNALVARELAPTAIAGITGEVRISRIRGMRQTGTGTLEAAPFLPAGTYQGVLVSPNPDITPNAAVTGVSADLGRAAITARREEITFEFTNIIFNPTVLKICKIAGNGVAVGTTFNFTVTGDTVGGLLPAATVAASTTAGPGGAGQNGFCTVVDAGAAANGGGNGFIGGAFNTNQQITITEAATAGLGATSITSSTGPITISLAARTATLFPVAPTTVVTYINSVATGAEAVRFDFDGDKKSDASIFTPSTARWSYAESSLGGQVDGFNFGRSTDILTPADFDGDGIYDRAVFRPENGQWYWLGSARGEYRVTGWGQAGDIPLAGDFDADGRADLVVFRPSNGVWYMNRTSSGFSVFQFGVSTDKPLVADFDGDHKMDAAVFRPSTGQWFVAGTKDGFAIYNFGVATDKPVAADYDGDGKADVAVFRNSGGVGTWFILGSTGNYRVINFGNGTDTPVPADYDGDGKTDLAVYRSSEGKWYIRRSSNADAGGEMSTISLGDSNDVALPSL